MTQRILVTAALPYANGKAHIGHLVEYTQADIYVRALKRLGEEALYICASDAHGTPIELNASRLKIPPEELVQRFHAAYQTDFARFDIAFDHYSITHSPTNREIVEDVYRKLRDNGHLEEREVDGNWCEHDQRFLPDRFIKGICPRCDTEDQYGDVCENCHATYAPTDLKSPRCALCDNTPSRKKSMHLFFKLSAPEHVEFLRGWVDSGTLQPDQANYVRRWIEGGLRDWNISRDGPYFGFAIPDKKDKYFYVWLDAPLGYVSSSKEWGEKNGVDLDTLWRSKETRIEHFIGRDIVYFHTLFWPAVLNATGYTLPSRVQVHGMLTVDGEKMSKTRGTFINADTFAEHVEPQALRFYYACKLGAESDDIDLSFDDFLLKVNTELVNKHANLFSRTAQFLAQKLDGQLGDLPFSAAEAQAEPSDDGSMLDMAQKAVAACRRIESHYRERHFTQVMRELGVVADIGNELMQAAQPWVQIKEDPEAARTTCTFAINICHALATYLWPVVPRFAEAGARVLGSTLGKMDASLLFAERKRGIGPFERLFERIDKKATDAMVEASKQSLPGSEKTETPKSKKKNAKSEKTKVTKDNGQISFDHFKTLDLRVGLIKEAEPVPKSKKLLRLLVDVGEEAPRQLVAGIGHKYAAEKLVGSRVIVVVNLTPAKIMGVESRGMVLAAGEGESVAVLRPDEELPPGTRVS